MAQTRGRDRNYGVFGARIPFYLDDAMYPFAFAA
jgi:hypothetical protein